MPKAKKTEKASANSAPKKTEKLKEFEFYHAVGRRKESNARVRLYPVKSGVIRIKNHEIKSGEILVNHQPIKNYFSGASMEKMYLEPFRTTNTLDRFAVSVLVTGGGKMGQLSALIHGVSRALVKVEEEKFRPLLRKRGFMTRDPRAKQRRMAGFAQKSRAKKQSPKR